MAFNTHIAHELQNELDRSLVFEISRVVIPLLANVDRYIDDQHKDTGQAKVKLIQSEFYFTIHFFDIDRSTISYKLMEKIVECNPVRIKDVCLCVDKQSLFGTSSASLMDNTRQEYLNRDSRKPIILDISVFYADTPVDKMSLLMDRFEFKHYRDTIVRDVFDEAWSNYKRNVDDFQKLIYLPETFPKNDSKMLEEVAYLIINMEKVMPITETTLIRDPLRKTSHYSLLFQNIQSLSYSFVEFLFDKFGSIIQDVRFEYHGNVNDQIATTSLLIDLLILDPLQKSSLPQYRFFTQGHILKCRQRSSSSTSALTSSITTKKRAREDDSNNNDDLYQSSSNTGGDNTNVPWYKRQRLTSLLFKRY
jgi:hypothetical protein